MMCTFGKKSYMCYGAHISLIRRHIRNFFIPVFLWCRPVIRYLLGIFLQSRPLLTNLVVSFFGLTGNQFHSLFPPPSSSSSLIWSRLPRFYVGLVVLFFIISFSLCFGSETEISKSASHEIKFWLFYGQISLFTKIYQFTIVSKICKNLSIFKYLSIGNSSFS